MNDNKTNLPAPKQNEQPDKLIVNIHSENLLVDARKLHEWLGVKSNFRDWIRNRISEYGLLEATDYIGLTESLTEQSFAKNLAKPKIGRPEKFYYLNMDTAKELAMVERTAKGRETRHYFISKEKELRGKRLYGQKLNLSELKKQSFSCKVNGVVMTGCRDTRGLLGYNRSSGLGYWRNKYPGLIINYNGTLVATDEIIEMWMLKATLSGKQQYAKALSENKPVLGKNFGQMPLNFAL